MDFRNEVVLARNTATPAIFPVGTLMGEDHKSRIISFKEMKFGSIQLNWNGSDAADAQVQLFVSNICDVSTFIPYGDSVSCLTADGGKIWNLTNIGFLYAYVDYVHNSVTAGTITGNATGKK